MTIPVSALPDSLKLVPSNKKQSSCFLFDFHHTGFIVNNSLVISIPFLSLLQLRIIHGAMFGSYFDYGISDLCINLFQLYDLVIL